MGSITTTISVNASAAVGQVEDLANAFKALGDEVDATLAKLKGGLDTGGLGKTAAAMDDAAAQMKAASKTVTDGLTQIGDASQAAAAKIAASADAAKTLADADKTVGDSAKAAADAQKALADGAAASGKAMGDAAGTGRSLAAAGKAVADSSPAAADGLKGVAGAAADQAKAMKDAGTWMAEYTAVMRDTSLMSADATATIAKSQLAVARSQQVMADSKASLAAGSVEQDAAMVASARKQEAAAAESAASSSRAHNLVLGFAGAAGYGIYQAAKFQTQMTRLYTSAGESQKNLPMISQGILAMAGPTATDQSQLAQGAYMIESAGFHGKDTLPILKAAAQGAQAEGAPLGEVGNALTSLMVSYKMRPQAAIAAMNQIITMVGSGKMTMTGAVSALPAVLPVASKSGLPFSQVGGALATMTATGMSPDQASQNLAHTIGALQGPSHVQTLEMQQLGINSIALSKNLGKEGLTGAIGTVESAILRHMGPAGTVMLDSLNKSQLAAQSARQEIAAMPAGLQNTAKAFLSNSISTKQFKNDLNALPPLQANMLQQFKSTADAAHGFNNQLKAGGSNATTFVDALSKVMGGQVGRNTALMLGGENMATFKANTDAVAASALHAGENVKGWGEIQKTFNFQLKSFESSSKAAATTLGSALLPVATTAMSGLAKAGGFLAGHKKLTLDLAVAGGGLALIEAGKKLASPLTTALQGVGKIAKVLKIPGLDKLADVGKNTGLNGAATGLSGAAGDLAGAAAELSGAAGKLATGGVTGSAEGAATAEGTAVRGAAGAEGTAAAEGAAAMAGGGLFSKLGKAKSGVMAAAGPVGIALIAAGPVENMLSNKNNEKQLLNTNPRSPWNSWTPTEHVAEGIGRAIGSFFSGSGGVQPGTGGGHLTYPSGGRGAALNGPTFVPAPTPARTAAATPGELFGSKNLKPAQVKVTPVLDTAAMGKLFGAQGLKPAKIKIDVDTGTVTGAMSKIQAALSHMSGGKVDMGGVISSVSAGMSAAAAAAQSGAGRVTSAVGSVGSKAASAAGSFAGAMSGAGASLDAGLASGISSGAGAAVGAAHAVAAQVAAAMRSELQISSPSKVAIAIGASTVQGLITGLLGGQPAVDAAAQALGHAAKPQDIAAIAAATTKIISEIDQAVTKHEIPKAEGSALTRMLEKDQTKLETLAAKRNQLEQEITDAGQITQSAISGASIMSAGSAQPPEANTPVSSDQTVTGMQYQQQQLASFTSDVAALKKQGLNATSLNQIIQSGAGSGDPVAAGLLQGGKSAIDQINAIQSQITKGAQQLGNQGAPVMYQAGQQAAQGIASGLKSQLSSVDSQMEKLAAQMAASLKKALAGSGAGSAASQIGKQIAEGIAQGISSAQGTIDQAVAQAMAKAEAAAKNKPPHHTAAPVHRALITAGGGGGGGGGSGGGGSAPVINVHVAGSVAAQSDLTRSIRSTVLQHASNNLSSGLQLTGRSV